MTDDNGVLQTPPPADNSGVTQTPPPATPPGDKQDDKKDDGMVPRERLNEESKKRKEAEKIATEKSQRLEQLEAAFKGTTSQADRNDVVDQFAKNYNLPIEFVNDLAAALTPKFSQSNKPDPIAIEAHAEMRYAQELDDLEGELPEIAELTREEKKELKKRRFSPEFIRTPLKSVYRDMMFDKQQNKKSFESSRSGGRVDDASSSKEFKAGGSVEAAREWFQKNTSYGKRKR